MSVVIIITIITIIIYAIIILKPHPFVIPIDECTGDCETCEFRDSEDCMEDIAKKYLNNEDSSDSLN